MYLIKSNRENRVFKFLEKIKNPLNTVFSYIVYIFFFFNSNSCGLILVTEYLPMLLWIVKLLQ